MPNADTFSVRPIGDFVRRYLAASKVSVDPFARNKRWATLTNDLNPETEAEYHLDAEDFLKLLASRSAKADLVIFDPPYSPRQISECYKSIGREVGMKETQNAALYARVRNAIAPVLTGGGYRPIVRLEQCRYGNREKIRDHRTDERVPRRGAQRHDLLGGKTRPVVSDGTV